MVMVSHAVAQQYSGNLYAAGCCGEKGLFRACGWNYSSSSSRRIHTVVERMRAATFYILPRAVVKHYDVSCSGVLCVWR